MKARIPGRGRSTYLRQIRELGLDPPTPAQELELIIRTKQGCEEARQELIHRHLRYVIWCAGWFHRAYTRGCREEGRHSRVRVMDLIQAGNLGLLEAIPDYIVGGNARFITYARYHIVNRVIKAIHLDDQLVSVPDAVRKALKRWDKAEQLLMITLGDIPHWTTVAAALRLKKRQIKILEHGRRAFQVRARDPDENQDALDNLVADLPPVEDYAERRWLGNKLYNTLEYLKPLWAATLVLRYGLGDDPPMTFHQIGEVLGRSGQRARDFERYGFYRLARDLHKLAKYFEP
jgi:RNA polymerase sigma factor (sigma-70 family)